MSLYISSLEVRKIHRENPNLSTESESASVSGVINEQNMPNQHLVIAAQYAQ